jgi:hypothetical protein
LYENYVITKETNKLSAKLDAAIELISSKLRDRIRNSVIVTKYPKRFSDTDPSKVDFKSISEIQDGDTEYKILEWINKDYEAKNGMWDSRVGHIQTGWSGFIDFGYNSHKTQDNPKEFNLTTPDSNFTIVKLIDRNISAGLGVNQDPFENNITTLIFSGNDMGGDLVGDINHSYGWYYDESRGREARAVFAILGYNDHYDDYGDLVTDMNITAITENNDSTLYARYFLTRTAYALVPVENNETRDDNENVNDFNVTFVYNYQPWQGDWYKDGNSTILARHVTEIRFKKDITSPVIRLYICIQSPDVIIDKNDESDPNDNRYLTLCKEKAIF